MVSYGFWGLCHIDFGGRDCIHQLVTTPSEIPCLGTEKLVKFSSFGRYFHLKTRGELNVGVFLQESSEAPNFRLQDYGGPDTMLKKLS